MLSNYSLEIAIETEIRNHSLFKFLLKRKRAIISSLNSKKKANSQSHSPIEVRFRNHILIEFPLKRKSDTFTDTHSSLQWQSAPTVSNSQRYSAA